MNDLQIKAFFSVLKAGSFSKAAENELVSKQALLKQIKNLEEELGFRLFIRSRSGVSVTAAGEIFRDGIAKMDREMSALIRTCKKAEGSINTIRVGNVEHQALLNPVTQAFTARYPDVHVQQVIHPNHSGEWRVQNKIQDVAETFRLAWLQSPDAFSYHPLTNVPYVAAMHGKHELSHKKKVGLAELAAYETMFFPIMLEEAYVQKIREAFALRPENLIERADVDHQVEAAYSCIDSDRILITANPFIEGITDLVKIPLTEGWMREYGIIFQEPASKVVQHYIETAIEVYGNLSP